MLQQEPRGVATILSDERLPRPAMFLDDGLERQGVPATDLGEAGSQRPTLIDFPALAQLRVNAPLLRSHLQKALPQLRVHESDSFHGAKSLAEQGMRGTGAGWPLGAARGY
jgi:hypothetical protein